MIKDIGTQAPETSSDCFHPLTCSLTDTEKEYRQFWSEVSKRLQEERKDLTLKTPGSSNTFQIPIGYPRIHLELGFHGTPRNWFEVGLHLERLTLEENRQIWDMLKKDHVGLKKEIGEELQFECPWNTKWARVYAKKQEGEMTEELMKWSVITVLKFLDAFKSRLDRHLR